MRNKEKSMSEPIPAEIEIGGQFPASLVEDLLSAIDEDGAATDWDGDRVPQSTDELLKAVAEDTDGQRHLRLCYSDANYGQFPSLEGFLREHQVPYDRHSDAKYEYDGELVRYRPGMPSPRVFHASQDGQILVPASDLAPLLALLDVDLMATGVAVGVQNTIEAASRLRFLVGLNVPELPAFEIVAAPA
jgi:hypothetical protein